MTRPERPADPTLAEALVRLGLGPGHYSERDLQRAVDEAARIALTFLRSFVARGHFVDFREVGNGYTVVADLFRESPEFPMLQRYLGPIAHQEKPDLEHIVKRFRAVVRRYTLNWIKRYIGEQAPTERRMRRVVLKEIKAQELRYDGFRVHFCSTRNGGHDSISSRDHLDELLRACDDSAQVPELVQATRSTLHEREDCAPWIEINQVVHDYGDFFTFRLFGSMAADPPDGPGKNLIVREWYEYWTKIHGELLERFRARTDCVPQPDLERVFVAFENWLRACIESGTKLPRDPFLAEQFPDASKDGFRLTSYRRLMDWLMWEAKGHFLRKFGPDFGLSSN